MIFQKNKTIENDINRVIPQNERPRFEEEKTLTTSKLKSHQEMISVVHSIILPWKKHNGFFERATV